MKRLRRVWNVLQTPTSDVLAVGWKSTRRLWAAVALALFPFLFIIDERFDFAFSPVLPGLFVLTLLWALAPYVHFELRRKDHWTVEGAERMRLRGRYLMGGAIAWLVLWTVLA